MAAAARTGRSTRRDFMRLAGLGGGAIVLTSGSWGRRARAQALKSITASPSVSTFVYGQHLVAAQKKFFDDGGIVPTIVSATSDAWRASPSTPKPDSRNRLTIAST